MSNNEWSRRELLRRGIWAGAIISASGAFGGILTACSSPNQGQPAAPAGTSAAPSTAGSSSVQKAVDPFPTKPIEGIIPFAAGGGHDTMATPIWEIARKKLNQPIVSKFMPGAGGRLGWNALYAAAADGYSIATFNNSAPIGQALFPNEVDYDITKLTYLMNVNAAATAVAVHRDSDFGTIQDFVNHALKNPGKVKMGSAGIGSRTHMSGLKLAEATGAKFTYIPYKGSAEYRTALLAKDVDFVMSSVDDFVGHTDYVRIVCTLSPKRHEMFPDVPTLKEAGYRETLDIVWRGFVAPPGVPQERVDVLIEAHKWAVSQPEYEDLVKQMGWVNEYWGPEEFKEIALAELNDTLRFKDALNAT